MEMKKHSTEYFDIKGCKFSWCVTKHDENDFTLHAPTIGFPHIYMTKTQLFELYELIRDKLIGGK